MIAAKTSPTGIATSTITTIIRTNIPKMRSTLPRVTAHASPSAKRPVATTAAGQEFSILSPTETISPYSPAWRAVSLMIPRDRAVGGLISAGQRVDLIAAAQLRVHVENESGQMVEGTTLDGYYSADSIKVAMTDIEVLAKDPDSDIYVLKVDLHQAEEIATLQGTADFSIALRPQGDNRIIDRTGYGQTLNRVIEHYLYPLPRIIQVDRYPKPDPEVVPEGSPTVEWPAPDPALVASPSPGLPVESPLPSTGPEASPDLGSVPS